MSKQKRWTDPSIENPPLTHHVWLRDGLDLGRVVYGYLEKRPAPKAFERPTFQSEFQWRVDGQVILYDQITGWQHAKPPAADDSAPVIKKRHREMLTALGALEMLGLALPTKTLDLSKMSGKAGTTWSELVEWGFVTSLGKITPNGARAIRPIKS